MSERFGRLPMRSFAVFEAAARHGKFASAAQELAMTQAGVSQHISQLEADLGVSLFYRQHRGVALTAAGEAFQRSVKSGLRTLSDGVASVRQPATERTVRILTDFGFAAWWLMPRIASLTELMPNVEIRLVTTQSEIHNEQRDFDLAIIFGSGKWRGCHAFPLYPERIYPVCSPAYLAGRALPLAAEEIAQLRLLHLNDHSPKRWFDWDDWFSAMGAEAPPRHQGLVFSNYQTALQAALFGQGVGIGWVPLVDDLIQSGSLIRLTDQPLSSSRGYYLVQPSRPQGRHVHADTVAAWLVDEHSQGLP